MAIEKHTTRAFVLASYEDGEHNRVYKIFTEEFGIVFAKAVSIRKLTSKLRAHVAVPGVSQVTLVKGKNDWRLVGGEHISVDKEYIPLICHLLERFVRGVGPQRKLFAHCYECVTLTVKGSKEATVLAVYFLFLVDLGYADATQSGAKSIQEYLSWNASDHILHVGLSYAKVRSHIESVLKEMQL